jgi:hypothetical protein
MILFYAFATFNKQFSQSNARVQVIRFSCSFQKFHAFFCVLSTEVLLILVPPEPEKSNFRMTS